MRLATFKLWQLLNHLSTEVRKRKLISTDIASKNILLNQKPTLICNHLLLLYLTQFFLKLYIEKVSIILQNQHKA